MKKRKSLIRSIFVILFVIFVIFSFYDFIIQTNNINTNTTLDHLKDVGKETANNYNQRFSAFSQTLKGTAELIGNYYQDEEDIGNILDNAQKNNKMFERLWFVDTQKHLYNYKDNIDLEHVNNYVDRMLEGEAGITDPFESPYNQKMVVVVYNPVYHNEKIIGGVIGIVEINNENHDYIYNDIFDNEAYVFATASDGHIISKIKNENTLYDGDNYFEFLENNVEFIVGDYKKIQNNIQSNESGFISYKFKGSYERLVYYTPVKINNWYVFTVISRDIVVSKNDNTNNITFLLIIKITISFMILMSIIIAYFRKINKMNKDINKKLVESNRKVEIVLKQTNDRIFEYDIENDSLNLDAWNDYPKILLNNFLSNLHNYNFVSKEQEQLLKDKFKEIIDNHQKIIFDAKFPYISKDDKTWFHVSIIYIEENKKLIGTLKNSTKEMEEYNILLQDQMFKNSVYSHASFMFAVNLNSRKVVIYQRNGVYYNIIDEKYEDTFLDKFMNTVHKDDYDEVLQYFSYKNIQTIFQSNENGKIEYRIWDDHIQEYRWIRYRIQFERQSSNNELLMIAYCVDINDEKNEQLENEFKAKRDGLTGLYNRQTFNQFVDDYLKNGINMSNYCAYMIIDLDDFKSINDSLGHSVGDDVIKKVAAILDEVCDDKSIAGRFGGDEFIVFFYEQQSYGEIERKAQQIINDTRNIHIDEATDISASIGMTFVKDEMSNSELFDKCDKVLYDAKKSGKSQYYIYRDE